MPSMPLNALPSTAATLMVVSRNAHCRSILVLTTVLETCEFNNLNVLKFLLSKETTLEGLLRMAGRKAAISSAQ